MKLLKIVYQKPGLQINILLTKQYLNSYTSFKRLFERGGEVNDCRSMYNYLYT